MVCHNCKIKAKKSGMFKSGLNMIQRYRCKQCKRSFSEDQNRPLGDMRIPMAKAVMAIQLLLEGCAVASVERMTGLHKRTILDLMVLAGERCERLMEKLIKDVPVRDVAIDEVWHLSDAMIECYSARASWMKPKAASGPTLQLKEIPRLS